uniref:FANCI solenoid 4 domain-containing protein n=1 Tax=Arundo donax TaxID=35708 RepID=A0A0A9GLQ7_ARUDO
MFKREDMVRIAATNAIVDLIIAESKYRKNEVNSFEDSSSQPSCSQQPEAHIEFGGGLFQELSGLLRRCLSQQARIKEVLYEGLIQIVTSDPIIADNVLDFLWPHFLNYYTEDDGCPLKIDSCFKVDNAKLCIVEPLHCLLSCISSILRLQQSSKCERPHNTYWKCFGFAASQDNEAGRAPSSDLFMKALSNIQNYLRKSLTEDQRGQSQEAGSLSLPLEMAYCYNFAMLRIIEVFIDFAASELEKATDESKETIENEIMELADAHSCFERKTSKSREKVAWKRGDSSDATDTHTNKPKENSNASLQKLNEKMGKFMDTSLYELVVMCVKQYNADNHDKSSQRLSQTKLKRNSSLVSFVLKVCLELFKSIATKESGDIIGSFRIILYEDVKKLIRPIMQLIWCIILDAKQENGGTKRRMTQGKNNTENRKEQLYLALTCLKELFKPGVSGDHSSDIIDVLISSAPPDMEDMLDAVQFLDKDTNMVDDRNTRNAYAFLNILKMLYARVLSQSLLRESEAVTELILGISRKLHPKQRHLVGDWAADLCKKTTLQSPGTARDVVKLAIHLIPAPNDMTLVSEMTAELITCGDEGSRDYSDTFHIINYKTKNSLAAVFLQMVESSHTELDWGLGKLKAMLTLCYDSANAGEDQPADERMQRLNLEEALYSRSTLLVHALSSFTHMSLKDTQAEQFLKLTAKFYKLLTRMSKSQIAPKGYTQSIPDLKFQKLVEVTCRMLTALLYDFVSSIQQNQQTSKKGTLAKIRRESKCIPDLIFQIEDYEKYLIQLSKLTKLNLLRYAKRSVARDFLIRAKEKSGEQQEEDCTRAGAASSKNESDEDAESPNPPVEANADENVRLSAQCGNPVQDSESDGEEEEILARSKRAKTSQVVQDSDEEGQDE